MDVENCDLAFLPLANRSYMSMARMKAMQPLLRRYMQGDPSVEAELIEEMRRRAEQQGRLVANPPDAATRTQGIQRRGAGKAKKKASAPRRAVPFKVTNASAILPSKNCAAEFRKLVVWSRIIRRASGSGKQD